MPVRIYDAPSKKHPNPPPIHCMSCKQPAGTTRYIVSFKGAEWKLCNPCHKKFMDVFGTSEVKDPNAVWNPTATNGNGYQPMACHFCTKEISRGYAVAEGTECDDCHGKVKHINRRGKGIKRKGSIADAPPDVIAAARQRPKDNNPFRIGPSARNSPRSQGFDPIEYDYYAHMHNLYGYNQHLANEIDDYTGGD